MFTQRLYMTFQSSIIRNSQILETIQTFNQLVNGWIKEMWHTQTVEYYSVVKKNKHVTTRMNLKHIMLNERSQIFFKNIMPFI